MTDRPRGGQQDDTDRNWPGNTSNTTGACQNYRGERDETGAGTIRPAGDKASIKVVVHSN